MKKNIILSITLILVGAMAISFCIKPSSEEKMLTLLEETKAKVYHPSNGFSPYAQLAFLDSSIAALPPSQAGQIFRFNQFKVGALLQLGKSEEALSLLKRLERSEIANNVPGIMVKVKDDMALAYLRLGEQTNCITNHSVDACILPIKNGGVHKDTKGSRGSIEIYQRMIEANPNDLEARWLLNVAYMTLGKYPGGVPKDMLIPDLDKPGDVVVEPFQDIAPAMGMDIKNMAGGVISEDFDNDGFVDLAMSSWDLGEPMHYFKNNGDGSFSDLSEKSGLNRFTGGLQIMQTDYNNDGYKDIFVLRGAWLSGIFGEQPNSLLRNNKDGSFTDVTIDAGLLSLHPTQTATWNDFNNDGWLDVFIGNETSIGDNFHPCELYLNNQNGTFTEVAKIAGSDIAAFVKGVASGDYDNDGWKDLFLSTMSGRRYLLRNKGLSGSKSNAAKGLNFEDVTSQAGLLTDQNRSFTTWFFDYDNDGWLDILSGDYSMQHNLGYYAAAEQLGIPQEFHGQPVLYHNNHDGTFKNVTREIGLDKTAFAMGGSFGDIDNDGYLDIFVGTGNPNYKSLVPNKMFKNIGGKMFADVTTSAKVGNLQKGHGVAFADLDNDGDQDIYIDMGGAYIGDAYQSSFFMNPGQGKNNWISINLEGTQANVAAIGSRIKLTFRENGVSRSVYRDVNSGGSFGSAPLKREIGLGQATVIDEIEIKWHGSGLVQTIKNISPNQFIRIREGNDHVEKLFRKKLVFQGGDMHHSIPVCLPVAKASI